MVSDRLYPPKQCVSNPTALIRKSVSSFSFALQFLFLLIYHFVFIYHDFPSAYFPSFSLALAMERLVSH